MNEEIRNEANKRLDGFDFKVNKFIKKTEEKALKYSKHKTQVLLGIGGGSLAIPISLVIAHLTFLPFLPISIALSTIGIVSGIYFSRGKRYRKIERIIEERSLIKNARIEENRLASEEILRRINELGENAPQNIRQELWATYKKLNSYSHINPPLPEINETKTLPPAKKDDDLNEDEDEDEDEEK